VCSSDLIRPIAELAALAIPVAAWTLAADAYAAGFLTLLGWLALALATIDAAALRAPFALSAVIAAVGLARVTPDGLSAVAIAAATGVVSWVLLWAAGLAFSVRRSRAGMGGGDPPAFGALAVWAGPILAPWVLVAASALGLVWALFVARKNGVPAAGIAVPFATFLAAATVLVVYTASVLTGGGRM